MSKQSKATRTLLISAMSLFISLAAWADPDPGPSPTGPGGDPPTDPDAEVPFDGGLSMLLAAGAAYGTKKAADYRKAMKGMAGKS